MKRVLFTLGFCALLTAGLAQAPSSLVIFVDLDRFHRGRIDDPARLHATLAQLGALPERDAPTVIVIKGIDSRLAHSGDSPDPLLTRQLLIAEIAAELGAPTPIFLAGPWDTPEGRAATASNSDGEPGYFPTTPEELEATGYDWLIEPEGFAVRWDHDGVIPEFTANRDIAFGREHLRPVDIVVCADQHRITGWARSYRQLEPTEVAIGQFTRDCISGEVELPERYALPQEFLERHGLAASWFAVFVPDAYAIIVPLDLAEQTARRALGLAKQEVPLYVAAVDTVTLDGSQFVSAEEHATTLAELGITVDEQFGRDLPGWITGFNLHTRASILLLVNDQGEVVDYFAASPSNGPSFPTLPQALLRHGLF